MSVKKINIEEVKPRTMPGRNIYDLITSRVLGSKHIALEVTKIAPGKVLRPCHSHSSEEVMFVVSGKGMVWVDGSVEDLRDGDAVLWPSGSKHSLKNTGNKELVLVCAFSNPAYQDDYVQFEDIDPFPE